MEFNSVNDVVSTRISRGIVTIRPKNLKQRRLATELVYFFISLKNNITCKQVKILRYKITNSLER